MATTARVNLWGRTIGAVSLEDDAATATFEYDPAFIRSGIEVAPLMMPLSSRLFTFPSLRLETFHGLPGLLADSLPDRFGNALIDAWLARSGRTPESFNAVERLCYTGSRGMGALEYAPATRLAGPGASRIEVDKLVTLASEVLTHRNNLRGWLHAEGKGTALRDILRVGTSAGGARAKAVIAWNPKTNEVRSGQVKAGSGFEYWLMKFDGISGNRDKELEDPKGYGAIEHAYYRMAVDSGIAMSPCRLFEENGRRHFMAKRFDRLLGGGKLHMQSLCAMAHYDFNQAGAYGYEQALQVIRRLGLPMAAVEEQFRRMVFNIVARNQDDHVKNIAFLMDRSGNWSLSPAFDMTYSYQPGGKWTSSHQMTMNGKRSEFTLEDFKACANSASMKRGRAETIIEDVRGVVARWRDYADESRINPEQRDKIQAALRLEPFSMKPGEHKTVQARILEYAEAIGWTFVPREEAEQRRGLKERGLSSPRPSGKHGGQECPPSLFFDDLLDAKVREFNPRYAEAEGALLGRFRHLHTDIYGNREFVEHLRNRGTFPDHEEKRERDLILIDYDNPEKNVCEVTEEWAFHNGHYGTREDIVFLINGIPVLVIECKNANKDEAIALGVDQIRRYHRETPELFVPQQIFTATDAIGFSYGVTWNTVRRNIFNWKLIDPQIIQHNTPLRGTQIFADSETRKNNLCSSAQSADNGFDLPGRLEAKVKTFCSIPNILSFLKDYIIFAEKDEELNKYILRQHQTGAVEAAVGRALDPVRTRGLIWHTQGSGKTFTMIKAAEKLFRAPEADKPTILLMIDRNELEDQMLKNLAALGLSNLEHAGSIARLNRLLRDDYRGIIVTMIHKFRDMPADLNTRSNIYVLIDEAHRTTGGDLGNFLMAGLPKATFIGFTGTPVDKTAYGKGTFKTFGCEDDQGYLHKYSIADSIEDGTTLPLYYQLAPNEMLVPHETLDAEFLSLAEAEGVADIEELNKILERAVNLKNFLKGKDRIRKVAQAVAEHYRENVEPLGYKAFLVGVDREACAHYKHALDQFLPPDYSEVVYTGNNNDSALLKEFHLDPKKERQIRKSFGKLDQQPKILIVTEKLLTGFDAPVLYAMYLDKPMRDHTLLQAIARVNRPYENEAREMVKPHGFVLDFVGIFDKLEKALAFDSDEINAIVKDLKLLKVLFKNKMESKAPEYLGLIDRNFDDKDVDTLIEHFRDPERRKAFFKEYKEIEMLYEIISPDAFLRPFIGDYGTLSAIYAVVRKAYARHVMVDRDFQRKTNELVQRHIGTRYILPVEETLKINEDTVKYIVDKKGGDNSKVINLIKSIGKAAEEQSDDPYLIAMAERARIVQEAFEDRQSTTAETLAKLLREVEANDARKKEQAAKGIDGLTFFVYRMLEDAKIGNAEAVSRRIREAFTEAPNWKRSDSQFRELRKKVTFSIFAECDDLDAVTALVNDLFRVLEKAERV